MLGSSGRIPALAVVHRAFAQGMGKDKAAGEPGKEKKEKKAKAEDDVDDGAYKAAIPLCTDRKEGKAKVAQTKDAAVLSLICLRYHWSMGLLWPIFLHVCSQIFQFVIAIKFLKLRIEPLGVMYEGPQYTLLTDIIERSISTGTNLTANYSEPGSPMALYEPYKAVSKFALQACTSKAEFDQTTATVVAICVIILLLGKFLMDASDFIENSIIMQFHMDSFGEEKDREKDGKAIEKAMITPAAKTSIDTVHWVTKILIIFLVYLPHMLCQCFIAYVGAKYVLMQPSIGRMVKSALKIYFITKLSAFLMKAFASANMNKMTGGAVMSFKTEEKCPPVGWFQSVCKSLCLFILAGLWASMFVFYKGHGLITVGNLCKEYNNLFPALTSANCLPSMPWSNVTGTCGSFLQNHMFDL